MIGRITFMFALVFLVGCGDGFSDLHSLTGKVTRDGKIVTSGGLQFTPESGGSGGVTVDAYVNKDGTFVARSSRWNGKETVFQNGLRPGRYKVTYIPATDGQKTGIEVQLSQIVVVEAKENTVELTLPSKLPEGKGEERDDANPPEPKKD